MFSEAKRELKELMRLTHELAKMDATLAARPDIMRGDSYWKRRTSMETRSIELTKKYELL